MHRIGNWVQFWRRIKKGSPFACYFYWKITLTVSSVWHIPVCYRSTEMHRAMKQLNLRVQGMGCSQGVVELARVYKFWDRRKDGLTDNMQSFIWHGSQNLCQTFMHMTAVLSFFFYNGSLVYGEPYGTHKLLFLFNRKCLGKRKMYIFRLFHFLPCFSCQK